LSLRSDSTNYIQNSNSLQSGTTFYVSSGSVATSFTLPYIATSSVLYADSTGKVNGLAAVVIDPSGPLRLRTSGTSFSFPSGPQGILESNGHSADGSGLPAIAATQTIDTYLPGTVTSYAIKSTVLGQDPSSTGYGVYSIASSTGSGSLNYAGYFKSTGTNTSGNYALYATAPGGGANYALWVDSGQVQINSSMTVTGADGALVTYGVTAGSMTTSNINLGRGTTGGHNTFGTYFYDVGSLAASLVYDNASPGSLQFQNASGIPVSTQRLSDGRLTITGAIVASSATISGAAGASVTYGISVGSITINSGGSSGKTICWKTATTLGFCSSVVGVGGDCTCN
jgi:hypothetical protein